MGSRSLLCEIASESIEGSLLQCLNGGGGITNESVAWSGITHFTGPFPLLQKITRCFMKERISHFNCKTDTGMHMHVLFTADIILLINNDKFNPFLLLNYM